MKKLILIGLMLSLTGCLTKKQPPITEEFAPRETIEMEAVEEVMPEEVVEEPEVVELEPVEETLVEDEAEVIEEPVEAVLEPVEIPEEVLEEIKDETMELEEQASELYQEPSSPRRLATIKGDQISITYFFDYTSANGKKIEDMIKSIGGKFGPSILWIYRPMGNFGTAAYAAKASECGRQQKAWPGFHDALVGLEGKVTENNVQTLARNYPLHMDKFENCMLDPSGEEQLARYNKEAKNFKIESTPAFVIGEDVVFAGNYPPAFFEQMIQSFLSSRLGN